MNQNNKRGLYIYLAILMAVVFLVMSWVNTNASKKGVEYNRIVSDFLEDRVGEYQLDLNTRTLTYTLWEDMPETPAQGSSDAASSESGASSPSSGALGNPFSPFQTQPAQSKTKVYQVPSSNLFLQDVHEHVLEYNSAQIGRASCRERV